MGGKQGELLVEMGNKGDTGEVAGELFEVVERTGEVDEVVGNRRETGMGETGEAAGRKREGAAAAEARAVAPGVFETGPGCVSASAVGAANVRTCWLRRRRAAKPGGWKAR